MRAPLLRNELRLRLLTPAWWLLAAGSWLICAWLLFAQLQVYQEIQPQLRASGIDLGINDLLVTPTLNVLGILLLVVIPLLGMSAIAGERRSGRLAPILATGPGLLRLLLGKWLGILLPALMIAGGILGMLSSLALGMQLDWPRLGVALIGLLLLSGLASSVTLASSAFTRQPAGAFAAALGILIFLWLANSFTDSGTALYWLALAPRLAHALQGSLLSDDIVYFLSLTLAGLALAMGGLARDSESPPLRWLRELLMVAALAVAVAAAASLSQAHQRTLYRAEPLPKALLETLAQLQGPITVTAYAADYPLLRARIEKLLRPLQEYHPALELRWIDPQREPQLARELGITRDGELRIEAMGRSQRVTRLDHAALLRALRHLVRRGEPWIVALQGQGEAPIDASPRGLGAWTQALGEYGYRVVGINADSPIPDNAALLLVAAPRQDYPPATRTRLQDWLGRGGRLLWLCEGQATQSLSALTGVQTLPGTLVSSARRSDLGPLQLALSLPPPFDNGTSSTIVVDQAHALLLPESSPWQVQLQLTSDEHTWNETGALHGEVKRNPLQGELNGPHRLGLLLQRGQARVAVLGDSDLARNGLLGRADNRQWMLQLVNWLTDNQLDSRPAADDIDITWPPLIGAALALFHLLLGPLLLAGAGLWLQRRRRQG